MIPVPTSYYVALSAILFTLGVVGVLIRRNALIIFMSVELMLNAANLAFVAFSSVIKSYSGQIFVFFVIAVAAAEVAVGLALIISIYRRRSTVVADEIGCRFEHSERATRVAVGFGGYDVERLVIDVQGACGEPSIDSVSTLRRRSWSMAAGPSALAALRHSTPPAARMVRSLTRHPIA